MLKIKFEIALNTDDIPLRNVIRKINCPFCASRKTTSRI